LKRQNGVAILSFGIREGAKVMNFQTIDLSPVITLTREEFIKLCAANPEMKLERTAKGELIVMSPTGGETGSFNSDLNYELSAWNRSSTERKIIGKTFDSSTGFSLPKGSDRSPDAAWISLAKWESLTPEQRKGFLPLCPEFLIELLSPSDSWKQGQSKMEEYMDNGCLLGWLIDPKHKRVAIYRQGQPVEILDNPKTLLGEEVLPNFVLDISSIFGWG
jgi:Uma2 family endonuclease